MTRTPLSPAQRRAQVAVKITAAIGFGMIMAVFLSPLILSAPPSRDQMSTVLIVGGLLINSAWLAGIVLWALRWRRRRQLERPRQRGR